MPRPGRARFAQFYVQMLGEAERPGREEHRHRDADEGRKACFDDEDVRGATPLKHVARALFEALGPRRGLCAPLALDVRQLNFDADDLLLDEHQFGLRALVVYAQALRDLQLIAREKLLLVNATSSCSF